MDVKKLTGWLRGWRGAPSDTALAVVAGAPLSSESPVVRKMAEWYETKAVTSDKLAFRYLWNCQSDAYDDSGTADLNLLIGHVFGAAYVLTKNTHWLDFGDTMADSGVDAMYADRPKQWDQATRSFGKYLGYRALGKTP